MRIIQDVLHKKLLKSDVSAEIAYAGSILQACCQRIMFVRLCSGFSLYNSVFDDVYVQVDFVYITIWWRLCTSGFCLYNCIWLRLCTSGFCLYNTVFDDVYVQGIYIYIITFVYGCETLYFLPSKRKVVGYWTSIYLKSRETVQYFKPLLSQPV